MPVRSEGDSAAGSDPVLAPAALLWMRRDGPVQPSAGPSPSRAAGPGTAAVLVLPPLRHAVLCTTESQHGRGWQGPLWVI